MALVAKTPADARDVMIQGPSGILNISAPWERPTYKPSVRKLSWPNGCEGTVYSSKEYDTLRGPAHHKAWADEIAAWHYPKETWDNLMFGLRLGENPQAVVTSTPRPIPLIKSFFERAGRDVAISSGSTYENRGHLPRAFFDEIISRYEGTTLGQQELYAKLISDDPRALWTRATIEKYRVLKAPELRRIVIAIDPPAASKDDSAEAGITAEGLGDDGHGYLLEDASVAKASPEKWGRVAVVLYHKLKANSIIAEGNNGGEMVTHVIRSIDDRVPVELVHASRGKATRAEPIAAMYEQGKIHHVGTHGALEDQMCTWVPGDKSPDRMDSAVWGLTKLLVTSATGGVRKARWN